MNEIVIIVLFACAISLLIFLINLYFRGKKMIWLGFFIVLVLSILLFEHPLFKFISDPTPISASLRYTTLPFLFGTLFLYEKFFLDKFRFIFWILYILTWIFSVMAFGKSGSPAPLLMPLLLTAYIYYYKTVAEKT